MPSLHVTFVEDSFPCVTTLRRCESLEPSTTACSCQRSHLAACILLDYWVPEQQGGGFVCLRPLPLRTLHPGQHHPLTTLPTFTGLTTPSSPTCLTTLCMLAHRALAPILLATFLLPSEDQTAKLGWPRSTAKPANTRIQERHLRSCRCSLGPSFRLPPYPFRLHHQGEARRHEEGPRYH